MAHLEKPMTKRLLWLAIASTLLFGGLAFAQYPMLDMAANKVIQKYQGSSCEQLWREKAQQEGQPRPEREQQAIQLLHDDPQMRSMFISKVAAPVVNKMFECGMIP
jgi:hypothetical protein